MQLPTLLTLTALTLASLVRSDACVESGPAEEVTAVSRCCAKVAGTWYQFYPVQAICVIPEGCLDLYKKCVAYVPGAANPTCIPGKGEGLSGGVTLTASEGPRTTIVA
ncbi:hypothetical protein V493_08020 [Pseudogymnoascus sp. VKM F-4281 (FW-2241)]|nr:hypothetical protein V493_08020 [Pseudogymnoascus sp. VKM F-4281 (FW-2241)]